MIEPEREAAATLIRHALRRLDLPAEQVLDYLGRFRAAMGGTAGDPAAPVDALPRVETVAIGHGGLADQSLGEARIRERLGVTVVAVTRARGGVVVNPPAETILRPGDEVRAFGLPAELDAFRAEAARDPRRR